RRDGECTAVERLVMQGAEREPIRHLIRAAGLEPLRVRRLDPDHDVHPRKPQADAAHGAALVVRPNDTIAEPRVAASPGRGVASAATSSPTAARMSGCKDSGKCASWIARATRPGSSGDRSRAV